MIERRQVLADRRNVVFTSAIAIPVWQRWPGCKPAL